MSPSSRADDGTRLDRRRRALAHALLVTGITTIATGCAHSLGGGTAPSPLLLAAAGMVTLAILAPVLGARASWLRRVVAVVVAQVVQHGLYSLPQPAGSTASTGHAHHAAETIPSSTGATVAHAHGDMLLAHVVAGAVTLLVLTAGGIAIAAVVGAVRGDRLVRIVRIAVPLGVPRPAPVPAARPAIHASLLVARSPLLRRGPPAPVV